MGTVLRRLASLFSRPANDKQAANVPVRRVAMPKRLPVLVLDASAAADEAAGAVVVRSANDPDFPAKRDAAEQTLQKAITQVLTVAGFRFDGKDWVRFGRNGTMTVVLLRSRWGYDCGINLRFAQGRMVRKHQLWFDSDQLSLGKFYTTKEDPRKEPGHLHYLNIFEGNGDLEKAMMILESRVVPFVEEHLNGPGKKAVADFVPVAVVPEPTQT